MSAYKRRPRRYRAACRFHARSRCARFRARTPPPKHRRLQHVGESLRRRLSLASSGEAPSEARAIQSNSPAAAPAPMAAACSVSDSGLFRFEQGEREPRGPALRPSHRRCPPLDQHPRSARYGFRRVDRALFAINDRSSLMPRPARQRRESSGSRGRRNAGGASSVLRCGNGGAAARGFKGCGSPAPSAVVAR
jgi:hypothetical protein